MKKKIDNRATCIKLNNHFLNGKVNSEEDIQNFFLEIIRRTNYGCLEKTHQAFYTVDEDPASFTNYDLIYPNSNVVVGITYNKQGGMETFDIEWMGSNGETKYSVYYE